MILEACVGAVEDAIAAQSNGLGNVDRSFRAVVAMHRPEATGNAI